MSAQLGHRWESSQGDLIVGDRLSYAAKFWLRTLKELTADEIAVGRAELEKRIFEASQKKEKFFAPSDIEFKAMCFPVKEQRQRGHKMNNFSTAKAFNKATAIESDEHKSKRKKAGAKHIDQLRDFLNE